MKLYKVINLFESFACTTGTDIIGIFFNKEKAIEFGKKVATIKKVQFVEIGQEPDEDNCVFIQEVETNDEPVEKESK